jgi:hypothetical protein
LNGYYAYIAEYASIDKARIMAEVTEFETEVFGRACLTRSQAELFDLSRKLALLKNLFSVSITREDYGYY